MSAEELNRQWDNDWVPQKYQKTDILRSGRQPHWTRCGGVRGRCSCPRFRHGPSRGSDCASPARQHHPELKGAHQTNSDDRCLWSGTLDCWAYQPANGFFYVRGLKCYYTINFISLRLSWKLMMRRGIPWADVLVLSQMKDGSLVVFWHAARPVQVSTIKLLQVLLCYLLNADESSR